MLWRILLQIMKSGLPTGGMRVIFIWEVIGSTVDKLIDWPS